MDQQEEKFIQMTQPPVGGHPQAGRALHRQYAGDHIL